MNQDIRKTSSLDSVSVRNPAHAARILLLLPLTLFLLESWQIRPQIDDAFISYRYARNLVEGNGLVFNIGEYVEGYTNLLWTILVAAGMSFGLGAVTSGHVLGFASGLAALYATHLYARTGLQRESSWIAAMAALALWGSTGFAYWSISGLETPLVVAAVLFALAAQARNRMGLATLAAAIATATRPDAGLVAVAIYGFQLASHWREGWQAWRWPILFGAFVIGLTLFRLLYYGDPLPNTFYAKVGGVPSLYGKIYFHRFLFDGSVWLLAPALFAAFGRRESWPGCVYVLLASLYVFRLGGDAFPYYRFLLTVQACLCALSVQGAATAYRSNPYAGLAIGASIPIALIWSIFDKVPLPLALALGIALIGWSVAIHTERPAIRVRSAVGVSLALLLYLATMGPQEVISRYRSAKRTTALATQNSNNHYSESHAIRRAKIIAEDDPPPKLVATSSVGAFGFYSRLPLLDIVGIVDPEIARSEPDEVEGVFLIPGHQRSNVEYVLSRKPEYIVTPRPWTGIYIAAFAAIWNHPDVARDYTWDAELAAYRRNP